MANTGEALFRRGSFDENLGRGPVRQASGGAAAKGLTVTTTLVAKTDEGCCDGSSLSCMATPFSFSVPTCAPRP